MLDEPINELKKTYQQFEEELKTDAEFFTKRKNSADEKIAFCQKVMESTNVSLFEKYVASYIVYNESSMAALHATVRVFCAIISKEMICINWTIDAITEVQSKGEKATISEEEKEKIEKLKIELSELQKQTLDMQPYVEMLKIGIEKKNKWMKDNV